MQYIFTKNNNLIDKFFRLANASLFKYIKYKITDNNIGDFYDNRKQNKRNKRE